MARLIDADARESFYRERMAGLEPYDHYCDGYGDAIDHVDDWMDAQPTVDAVPVEKYNALKERYERMKEIADILDTALRQYQRQYGE